MASGVRVSSLLIKVLGKVVFYRPKLLRFKSKKMENSTTGSRRIVILKKGEPVPINASQLSETEILDIQDKRIQNFTPQSEVNIFKYGPHMIGISVAMSGCFINRIYRKNFRLGGLKMFLTYAPSTVLPALSSVGAHDVGIKQRILLGKEPCSSCVTVKSGLFQLLMGLCYPCLVSVLSCLPVAREFYTLPMPTLRKGMGYLRLLRQVSPAGNTLILIGMLNMLIGMEVSRRELQTYMKHFSKPPSPPGTSLEEDMMKDEKTY